LFIIKNVNIIHYFILVVVRVGRPYCLYVRRPFGSERKQFPKVTTVTYTLCWHCSIKRYNKR